jgi:prepilin-type N-terminal cleavage/methylation domain-containing protein
MNTTLASLARPIPGPRTPLSASAQPATATVSIAGKARAASSLIEGTAPGALPDESLPERRGGFTLVEMLAVIAVIAVLAGLVVGLTSRASRAGRDNKIKVMRDQLVTAIESYQAQFGSYPPDNRLPSGVVNSAVNPLFYELTGMVVDNVQARFYSPDYGDVLTDDQVRMLFNREGFVNASPDPKKVRKFVELRSEQYDLLSEQPQAHVLVVPVRWPLNPTAKGLPPSPVPSRQQQGLNPWRYVSSNPTNNPGRFDLWAEFVDGGTVRMISNWHSDIVDRP